ncbi:winged helix-turn-helix transcriptional regulator [Phytomonospora endophytica]|uniref:DNA-binding HxlR family transcriptional regulator n=1 Tax=Phytomonospora endophytica TaxID=714109 RepID=A0A841FNT6_9ACTN|nr:helix-turn-helix domain-containing protein [Phytomonospora endophytica]MBB6038981.1 DNA-binding HxlR family transcriptional regulator [Phytomonospora endophytica]GIG67915.1 transcriptional regulator [Phytomonospora endophytica]
MSRRSYNQYCATAHALDLVGERWTLLLVRELLTGPRRFGDILGGLPGMGTGLLAARLKFLVEEGIVEQVTLPAPANTPAYALTEAGAALEPAVLALADWGMAWALGERRKGEVFRAGWAVLAMRSAYVPRAGFAAVYEFRVDDEIFHAAVRDGDIATVHGPAQRPDVVITVDDGDTFRALLNGEDVDGGVTALGDPALVALLPTLFAWPEARERVSSARPR